MIKVRFRKSDWRRIGPVEYFLARHLGYEYSLVLEHLVRNQELKHALRRSSLLYSKAIREKKCTIAPPNHFSTQIPWRWMWLIPSKR